MYTLSGSRFENLLPKIATIALDAGQSIVEIYADLVNAAMTKLFSLSGFTNLLLAR